MRVLEVRMLASVFVEASFFYGMYVLKAIVI